MKTVMKKSIKQEPKSKSSNIKKDSRPFTADDKGYDEEIYNNEEQKTYEKTDKGKGDKKNTSGPEA